MYLHENQPEFRELVRLTTTTFGLAQAFVLKDYYAVTFLKEITQKNPAIVFKGGTCLSKCYQAIDRFSEDVDLGIQSEHATEGTRKGMKRAVVHSADLLHLPIENIASTRSRREFNRFVIPLPQIDEGDTLDKLIVETAVMTPADPAELRPLQSFVGQFCEESGYGDLVEEYHLGTFEVLANSMQRTFCDKVYALCDYYLAGAIPPRQSRHIYDLRKLLDRVTLDTNLAALMSIVRKQRLSGYRCPSAEPDVNIPELLEEIKTREAYRHDYEKVTEPLLYETMSYERAATALTEIAAFLRTHEIDA